MATRRKKSTSSSSRSRSKRSQAPRVDPATLRSVAAVVLILAGVITLIALFLPGGGILNGYVDGFPGVIQSAQALQIVQADHLLSWYPDPRQLRL